MEIRTPGVHWGWWLFWLGVFWPALLGVYLIHSEDIRSYDAEVTAHREKEKKERKQEKRDRKQNSKYQKSQLSEK